MPAPRLLGISLALTAALGVAACGSSSVGTQVPAWAGGLPPGAPQRAAVQPPFPNLNDRPPARPAKLMSEQEQTRLEAELATVRDRVNRQTETLQKESADERR